MSDPKIILSATGLALLAIFLISAPAAAQQRPGGNGSYQWLLIPALYLPGGAFCERSP